MCQNEARENAGVGRAVFLRTLYAEIKGFPSGSLVKTPPTNAGDVDSIPGLGRSLAEGNGNVLWYSCLGNPKDREAWWVTVHEVT